MIYLFVLDDSLTSKGFTTRSKQLPTMLREEADGEVRAM